MSVRFTLKSPLTVPVLDFLQNPDKALRFKKRDYAFYEGRIWLVLHRLNSIDEEIRTILNDLTSPTFPVHVSVLLKMYSITTETMGDVFAWLISEVFDLGYDERQISLGSLLKNRHVVESGIPNIFKSRSAELRTAHFGRQRNDIVHRGVLKESRLNELDLEMIELIAANIDNGMPSEQGYEVILQKLRLFSEEKRRELSDHYKTVLSTLDAAMEILANEVRAKKD